MREQQTAPAKAKREYKARPESFAGAGACVGTADSTLSLIASTCAPTCCCVVELIVSVQAASNEMVESRRYRKEAGVRWWRNEVDIPKFQKKYRNRVIARWDSLSPQPITDRMWGRYCRGKLDLAAGSVPGREIAFSDLTSHYNHLRSLISCSMNHLHCFSGSIIEGIIMQ